MKLIDRVRPGVELTCATFWPSRELMRLDFPTFERPRKANSGGPSGGNSAVLTAAAINLEWTGFMGKERLKHYLRSFCDEALVVVMRTHKTLTKRLPSVPVAAKPCSPP